MFRNLKCVKLDSKLAFMLIWFKSESDFVGDSFVDQWENGIYESNLRPISQWIAHKKVKQICLHLCNAWPVMTAVSDQKHNCIDIIALLLAHHRPHTPFRSLVNRFDATLLQFNSTQPNVSYHSLNQNKTVKSNRFHCLLWNANWFPFHLIWFGFVDWTLIRVIRVRQRCQPSLVCSPSVRPSVSWLSVKSSKICAIDPNLKYW